MSFLALCSSFMRFHKFQRSHLEVINRISFTMSTYSPKKKLHDVLKGALSPLGRRPILNSRYMISKRDNASPSQPSPASRGVSRAKSSSESMQEMLSAYDSLMKEMDDDEGYKCQPVPENSPVRKLVRNKSLASTLASIDGQRRNR
jgi:hypothetical protein